MQEREYLKVDDLLTTDEFEQVKHLVLNKGDRKTYCNKYNNNPHLRFKSFDIYLNPSIHSNVNCNSELSDFNEIVIQNLSDDIKYYHLKIVRKGDRSNPSMWIPKELEENNVYLFNPYNNPVQEMRNELASMYLRKMKDSIKP